VRRLRGFSARAWRDGTRIEVVSGLVRDLAALSAPTREPPVVPVHVLPDVVAVLAYDAEAAGREADVSRLVSLALVALS